jgi:hypothetical protein
MKRPALAAAASLALLALLHQPATSDAFSLNPFVR